MQATKADVLAVAPEFSSLGDPVFAAADRLLTPLVPEEGLGDKATIAGAYRIAHFLAKTYPALSPDSLVVVERSLGPLSVKYANTPPAILRDLATTKYGLAYLEIIGGSTLRPARTLGGFVV
jgi:hypothetical protein